MKISSSIWNKHVLPLVFGAGLSCICSQSWAEDWYLIGTSSTGDTYFVDVAQLTTSGNSICAWVREDLKDAKFVSLFKSRISQYLDSNLFDCARNRLAMTTRYSRDSMGAVVESYNAPANSLSYVDIAPGAVGGSIVKFACTRGKELSPLLNANAAPFTPASAKTQDWRLTGTNEGDKIFVAADAITLGTDEFAGLVFFYQRWDYATPRLVGLASVRTDITLYSTNCATRNLASLGSSNFDQNGELLFRSDMPSVPKPIQPVAGSIGASAVEFVCAQAASRAKAAVASPTEPTPKDARAAQSEGFGTAWYADSGYFVTAQHVINGAQDIYIVGADNTPLKATVAAFDPKNDVAILKADIQDRKLRPLVLSKGTGILGARVFTIGYPHIAIFGNSPKITSGEVSGNLPRDPTKLLISVPVQMGNSGGPLINMSGEVVGLVIEKTRADKVLASTGDLTENVNFALKAKYIDALLDDLPRLPTALQAQRPKPSSVEELVGLYRDSVFLVWTLTPGENKK